MHTPLVLTSLPPELHLTIFSNLTKNELTIATRASKDWNSICTPLIWKTLSITRARQFWLFTKQETKRIIVKNGSDTSEFHLNYLGLLNLIATPDDTARPNIQYTIHCANLRILHVVGPSGYTSEDEDEVYWN